MPACMFHGLKVSHAYWSELKWNDNVTHSTTPFSTHLPLSSGTSTKIVPFLVRGSKGSGQAHYSISGREVAVHADIVSRTESPPGDE